ncbi:hypothetical protein R3P38DRAFT_319754 [Favolaschia claudopus]|uniref:Uncharacterized protein n=1 Tax=Favolaschia claudopus TaxID=2862362 RepID=A0AAW0CWB1_9AGAR
MDSNYQSLIYQTPLEGVENNDPQLSPNRTRKSPMSRSVSQTDTLQPARKRGIGILDPVIIVGGTVLAAVLAVLHHVFDEHLNGHSTTGAWNQTASGRIEIFLATAYKILFCFSAGCSLCQLTWYTLRRQPVTLADLDALVGAPSLMTLPRLNLILQTPTIIAMTAAILASPIITILAPSLNTHQASATVRTLVVPTLNTTTDAIQNDVYLSSGGGYGIVTEAWNKTALAALISAGPLGWSMPDGCEPECSYNFSYTAPAVRCTELQPDQIDDGVDASYRFVNRTFQSPPAAYLLAYDALSVGAGYRSSPLNFTVQNEPGKPYTWTLAYVPYLAENAADGALINASGSACVFYNATYQARTHYFNGTQESSTSILEFHDPLNTTYRSGIQGFGTNFVQSSDLFQPGVGAHIHLLAMADAISGHLQGSLTIDGHFGYVQSSTLLTETNIFEPYNVLTLSQVGSANPGLNTTAAAPNVSQALQDFVGNVTLGYVSLMAGKTAAAVTVASKDLVYTYDAKTLIATYAASFLVLVVMSGLGMYCLISNGESSSNSFSYLLLASRNPELDVVADSMVGRNGQNQGNARLVFGRDVNPERGNPVIGLAREHADGKTY